jgi:hypothetical protein
MSKNNSIIPLVEESNRVLSEAIKHFGLSVPMDNIVVTIQSKGRKQALGWFWSNRWTPGSEKSNLHEINLSAEYLREHNMGETLIHELAHAENHHCGIADTDKTGRRHNKKFKSMAEKLGLTVEKSKSLGFAHTALGPEAEKFLSGIKFNRELFELCRIEPETKEGKAGSRLVKCQCPDCGYVIRTTRKWIETGFPICPCNGIMEEVA